MWEQAAAVHACIVGLLISPTYTGTHMHPDSAPLHTQWVALTHSE